MQINEKVYEDDEVEKLALILSGEEIEIIDRKGNIKGRISEKQIVKRTIENKTLNFRIKDVINTKITEEEEKSLPKLKDIFFDAHLLMYGKRAEEVKMKEVCNVCGLHIDEYGYCGCGSGSD